MPQEKENSPAKVESQLPPKIVYDSLNRKSKLRAEAMAPARFLPVIQEYLAGAGFPPVTVVRYEAVRSPYSTIEGTNHRWESDEVSSRPWISELAPGPEPPRRPRQPRCQLYQ